MNSDPLTGRWALDIHPEGTALETFVQWKGTDVCMDAWCPCGEPFHVDGYFAHQVQCPHCDTVYELSTRLLVRVVTGDEQREGQIVLGLKDDQ